MNVKKYAQVQGIFMHNYREGKKEHPSIDSTLTHQNFSINNYDARARLRELKKTNKVRNKTTVQMFDWVIQYPDNCDMPTVEFFAECVCAMERMYGAENILGDTVHLDEPNSKAHIHIMVAPCIDGKFNAKAILTKSHLEQMHDFMNDHFKAVGYEGVEFHAPDYQQRKERNRKRKETRKKAIHEYTTVENMRDCLADEVQALEKAKTQMESEVGKNIDEVIAEQEQAEMLEYLETYFPDLKAEILARGREKAYNQQLDEVEIR